MASAKFDSKTGVIVFETEDGHKRLWSIPDFAQLPVQLRDLAGVGASLIGRNVAALSQKAKDRLTAKGVDVAAHIREKLDAIVDEMERGEYSYSARAGSEAGESTRILTLALQILRRRSIAAGKQPAGSDDAVAVLASYNALPINEAAAVKAGKPATALNRAELRGGAAYKAAVVQARKELGLDDEQDGGGF